LDPRRDRRPAGRPLALSRGLNRPVLTSDTKIPFSEVLLDIFDVDSSSQN
jgi:hypothetical protein